MLKIITLPKKQPMGLISLRISPDKLSNLKRQAKSITAKELFNIVSIEPHPKYKELANLTVKFSVMGGFVQTKMTVFIPLFDETPEFEREIDDIEEEGLKKATEFKLYTDKGFEMLQKTFCSGLVACAYPPIFRDFIDNTTAKLPGFTKEARVILDFHMRALFSHDDTLDHYHRTLAEHPEDTQKENELLMKWVKAKPEDIATLPPSHKGQALRYVMAEIGKLHPVEEIKRYFISTLKIYLASTQEETETFYTLTWPSEMTLEGTKEDSSGSNHAIACGATVLQLEKEALSENKHLNYIQKYTAKAVESHNDVMSHPKELRQRIKKLFEILEAIDTRYEEFQPFIEKIPLDKIADKELRFLTRFYRAAQAALTTISRIEDVSENALLKLLLNIVPSFNMIDITLHEEPRKTLEDCYKEIAQRGNQAVEEMASNIVGLQNSRAKYSSDYVVPDHFHGSEEEFWKQANSLVNLCVGWGSQDFWENEAPRYNEAKETVKARDLLDLSDRVKKKLEEAKPRYQRRRSTTFTPHVATYSII